MEPFHGVGMQTHPCFTFYTRMVNCAKNEELPSRMCMQEVDDWVECKTRKKHRAFQNFVQAELAQMQIFSLPTYDERTDSFKDGPLPRNVDSYFSKGADAQTYYQ